MERPYRHISVAWSGDVTCVRLRKVQFTEDELYELFDDLNQLVEQDGCRKLVLSLGPEEPQFLYSVFLAKLVSLQRRLNARNGGLKLCEVSPDTMKIFEVCRLDRLFEFHPDQNGGVTAFSA
jgi:stage II sporulation protein AA (anti-sigma F factor antagonist)